MLQWAYAFQCKNPVCKQTIYIRSSSQEGTYERPTTIPKDEFPIRLVCPQCGRWSLQNESDDCRQLIPVPDPQIIPLHRLPVSWRIPLICGVFDCRTPTAWYLNTEQGTRFDAILAALRAAKPEIVCRNNGEHSLVDATPGDSILRI